MAFAAEPIGTGNRKVRVGKQVRNGAARRRRLAYLVAAFENVHPLRTMRAVRPTSAKFAVVVVVVAVRAENANAHVPAGCYPVQLHHLTSQAGLGHYAASVVQDRM